MKPAEALEQPLLHLGQMLRGRQVTSSQLVEESLRRLEKTGRALNAVAAVLPERARAEAAAADRELAAGRWRGPLHGVP
jgi:Asp-tRNA(Asn)/Glu-tRNA(Gln) amidotransferase A subunit family amidase